MTRISTDEEERHLERQKRLNTIHRNMMAKCDGDDSNCTTGPPTWNTEAVWKLVMAMKLNGLPKEALNLGFMTDREVKQFEEFFALSYADLCKWGIRRD